MSGWGSRKGQCVKTEPKKPEKNLSLVKVLGWERNGAEMKWGQVKVPV